MLYLLLNSLNEFDVQVAIRWYPKLDFRRVRSCYQQIDFWMQHREVNFVKPLI